MHKWVQRRTGAYDAEWICERCEGVMLHDPNHQRSDGQYYIGNYSICTDISCDEAVVWQILRD